MHELMTQAMENKTFRRMYAPDKLTLGVFMNIEEFQGDRALQDEQERIAKLADESGYTSLWVQDVSVHDPDFGDVRNKYDSFLYLTYLMALTKRVGLATASTVVTHRHPLRLAREANTLDQLSGGRFIMGASSGDRPVDFAGYGLDAETRGALFRETFDYYKRLTTKPFTGVNSPLGTVRAGEMVPQALEYVPTIIVGQAQQTMDWIAEHGDGWMNYARPLHMQAAAIREFRSKVEQHAPGEFKPFGQPLFLNLLEDPKAPPTPIRFGFTTGREYLLEYLEEMRQVGVNHVIIAPTRDAARPVADVVQEIAEEIVPHFPAHE
jgi:luciferase-type oxidoreductase